jgi:UDP-N-acetylglucosamine 3-dehydrogenase
MKREAGHTAQAEGLITRFAIVGAGQIGQVHARSIATLPDAEVAWIVDLDREPADRVAGDVGARSTADTAEAFSDAGVDAVLVAVPTNLHRPVVELAASHGKHVLCEKPISSTVADAEAMVDTCRQAGVRLMVGQVVRHFPEYARIKDVLEAGTLGAIGTVRASRVGGSPVSTRRWLVDPEAGGGVVVDLMIHELDTFRWYFGDIARVFATGFGPTETDPPVEYAQATVRFENGIVAHCEASWAHQGFRTRMEIAGEAGLLRHDSAEALPIRLEKAGRVDYATGQPERPYMRQVRHFIDQLRTDKPFLVEGVDGIRSLEAALAVSRSVRSGTPVVFESGRPVLDGAIG